MSDASPSTVPRDPVLQFRLRTLLAATTVLAILAAIAGPYYRTQTEAAQRSLLVFWTTALIFSLAGLWLKWRSCTSIHPRMGSVRFIVFRAWRRGIGPIAQSGIVVCALTWLAYESHRTVEGAAKNVTGGMWTAPDLFPLIFRGLWIGIVIGGMLVLLIRVPIFVCDRGIRYLEQNITWKQMRQAQWMPGRNGVMRLHRLDGDIYLKAPPQIRKDFEAFMEGKISSEKFQLLVDEES